MPIRWRLTFWFSLILVIILVLASFFIHTLLRQYLEDEVDDNLRVYSARVHGTLHPDEIPEPVDYDVIHSSLPPINEFASPGTYIQLIDENGNVVVKSDNLGDQELPIDPDLIARGFEEHVEIGTVLAGQDADLRIMVSPLFLKDQTLLLEVAQSLGHIDRTMNRLRWTLLLGILGSLVLAVISGIVLARRALAPVKRITGTARDIENSTDLSRRVAHKGPKDEVGTLANTFDHMLDHLDRVFRAQKDFVADASHDLRSPLTVIQGNLDLLQRDLSEEDRQHSLAVIRKETDRMNIILNDLLMLAEIESTELQRTEDVSLKGLVHQGLTEARRLTSAHQIVEGRIEEDLVVKGDPNRLEQMMANLVSNAIKYTPEGGSITLSLFRDGEWARLEVADAGVGIHAEHLPYVFDRFYRVDRARSRKAGGTGLGLAIVKAIAEQHDGQVTVQSEPGKGSIFTVWLKL